MAENTSFPGEEGVPHPEAFTVMPPQPKEKKVGQISQEQVKQFFDEGYTVVDNYFTPDELEPCKQAIEDMVDDLATRLFDAGKIKKLYKEYGVFRRLTMLENEFPGSNILLFKLGKFPKAFRDLWCSERLLNMIEQLVGPDVAGHPVWNLRTKTPKNDTTTVPWHQDSAYFSNDSYGHMVATAWIPFLDTDDFNGGMQVVRNGHKKGVVAKHTCCQGSTWYVMLAEDEMEKTLGVDLSKDLITTPVPYGGMLLFHNLTPHRSLINQSKDVRWSIDLRWQSPHEPWGFYNLQEGITMRTKDDPNPKIDWDKFLSVNRKEEWQKRHYKKIKESDTFDLTVTGPWIGQWEIVNHNEHTEAFCAK